MNLKNYSIFDKKENNNNKIFIFKKNKDWYFEIKGFSYLLKPADIVNMSMSPIVKGANELIEFGCENKIIKTPENGFNIIFNDEEYLNYDVRFELDQNYKNGWVYNVFMPKYKIDKIIKVWACDYLKIFYKQPPKIVYVSIEEKQK